tara:strand:+ start:124867 stop:125115 length:249 start_codon:yes stop_codon:yes gene_type:complete
LLLKVCATSAEVPIVKRSLFDDFQERCTMVETIQDTWREYSTFYISYLNKRWDNISPMEYGIVLVSIAVVGWLLMRSGARKA